MFQSIHLLPLYDPKESQKLQERWETSGGKKDEEYVIDQIKKGAGENFLQWDFEQGKFSVLKHDRDLRGLTLWKLDVDFPLADNFKAIDFDFSTWWHSKFTRGSLHFSLSFAKVYNCEFHSSMFRFFKAYGTTFEKCKFVDCDFIEHSSFLNCEFIDCEFRNLFFLDRPFQDCSFDSNTHFIGNLENSKPHHSSNSSMVLDLKQLPEMYKSIKEAFLAGGVITQYRRYYFLQRQAERKNCLGWAKGSLWIQEVLTGYGVLILRPVWASIMIIILFAMIYSCDQHATQPFLMSFAAFFTMGDVPQSTPFNWLFVLEGALGIGVFALYITILANLWFSDR